MSSQDQSIDELEFRIGLINWILRWLRSDDPMLSDPKYSPHIPNAIERYTNQLHEAMEVCRQKKIERDGDPNDNPVEVGLKTAKMFPSAGMK